MSGWDKEMKGIFDRRGRLSDKEFSRLSRQQRWIYRTPVLKSIFIANAFAMATLLLGIGSLARAIAIAAGNLARRLEARAARVRPGVPRLAETILLLVLPRRLRRSVPGDLQEQLFEDSDRWGLGRARMLYWQEVARYVLKAMGSFLRYGIVAWLLHRTSV
jgi:hypothetical protein